MVISFRWASYLFVCGWMTVNNLAWSQDEPAETASQSSTAEPSNAKSESLATVSGRRIDVILDGLSYPSGIAIQPETGTVFVSDSGKGQVVRMENGQPVPVLTDFPLTPLEFAPDIQLGPMGLLFSDRNTLWVASGRQPDGQIVVRVFKLPEDLAAMKAEAAQVGMTFAAEETESTAQPTLFSMATNPEALFATVISADGQGWIGRAPRADPPPTNIERFIELQSNAQSMRSAGITISPHGYLVIGTLGTLDEPSDGQIVFFDPVSKKMLLRLESGLHDISAVGYSPRKQMYALDLALAKPEEGGLFRIIADAKDPSGMSTKKIADFEHPTAMVFDSDGGLYVTVAGLADESGTRPGKLLKVPSEESL